MKHHWRIVKTLIRNRWALQSMSFLPDGSCSGWENRKRNTFNMLMDHCIERGWATTKPEIKKLVEGEGRTRFFTYEEWLRIRSKMTEHYGAFAEFLLWTGCRIGETQALRWQDCADRRITLRWQTTKGAKTRTLPLTSGACTALSWVANTIAEKEPGPWSSIEYNTFHDVFVRAKISAGLGDDEEIVPHTLRHTCASWMVQTGVGIEVVQKWLGHSAITTTMRYAHLAPNALEKAAELLDSQRTVVRHVVQPVDSLPTAA